MRRISSFLVAVLAVASAVLVCGSSPVEAAEGDLEYAVKAAYLSKFGIYVDWPPESLPPKAGTLVLCIVGEDPIGDLLDKAVEGQRIKGHPVTVRHLNSAGRNSGCHILYASGSDAGQVLAGVRGSPVLTVTDQPGEADGAVIRFVIRDNRVRFAVDDQAAARNGLVISSELLKLAVSVVPRK